MRNNRVRVMVVGAQGGLGGVLRELIETETGWQIIEVSRDSIRSGDATQPFDTANRSAWRTLFESDEWRPDVVVNTAAMTNVDACEVNRTEAWRNNVTLVEHLVAECKRHGKKLIQVSTDYVFDGVNGPYTEHATPNPVNYYGKTKLASENACVGGEINHAIIRTMWLYGEHRRGRPSFVTWLADALATGASPRVVTDEVGNPTFIDDVAYGIIKVIERDLTGVLNIAGPDLISRWDFALAVAAVYELDPATIVPVSSADLGRTAKRPLRSGLITLRAQTMLGLRLTGVRDGLGTCRIIEQRILR